MKVLLVLCCAALGWGADTSTIESYLLTVAQSKQTAGAPLSESETRDVVAIATDYVTKSSALGYGGVVFEARLRAIAANSTNDAEWEQEQMRALERRRAALLTAHIEQLKTVLGNPSFSALELHIEAWHRALMAAPRPKARK
jgi:hypothetical protein